MGRSLEGPRGTEPEEFGQVLELVDSVFWGGQTLGVREHFPLLFNEGNLDNLRIVLVDGKPVSHVGICENEIVVYGCKAKVGSIGSVCTHPGYRNRGFATKVLGDCFKKMAADDVDIVLISGDRGLYRRAGCLPAGRVYKFKVRRGHKGLWGSVDVRLGSYKAGELHNLVKAYQNEPVRFKRGLEDFRLVLAGILSQGHEVSTVYRDGEFCGYLVLWVREKRGGVVEYAGVRKALVAGMATIFDRYGLVELDLSVPWWDKELIYLLRQRKLRSKLTHLEGHTLKVINLRRLMDRFQAYVVERVGRIQSEVLKFEEDGSISMLDEEVSFGDDLVKLVFGAPEKVKIPLRGGKLSKILGQIFPLPLVWPGMNYV